MFRHPKYYKELRKRALDERNKKAVAKSGISSHASLESDQAISPMSDGSPRRRSPGPDPQATSSKPQAASVKHQAVQDS